MVAELLIINNIILSIALLIAVQFFSYWKVIRVKELGLVGMIFFSAYIAILANNASVLTGDTLWFQLAVFNFNTIGLALIYFYLNLHKNRFEKAIKIVSWIWYILLTILLLFWKSFEQPDRALVLFFFEMNHTRGDAHPLGAGLKVTFNGRETIIYSTSHQIIGILFWLFSVTLSLYQLYRMEVPDHQQPQIQERILKSRRNFLIERALHFIWIISLLPIFPTDATTQSILSAFNILVLISYSIIAYTVLTYPEALVMSKDQFAETFKKITESFQIYSRSVSRNTYISKLVNIIENYNITDLKGSGIVIRDLEEPYGFYISKSSLIRYNVSFKDALNTLLIANFIAAFSSFSDEIFDQRGTNPRVQRTRNGEFEVYVLIIDDLMFAYLFRGISLLLNTKMNRLAQRIMEDKEIRRYLYAENARQNPEILKKIERLVHEEILVSEMKF